MTTITATIGTSYAGAGGTVIGATVGDWVRSVELVNVGTVGYAQYQEPHILPVGVQRLAESTPLPVDRELVVLSQTTATAVGSDAREGAALDEWRLLNDLFKPYDGPQFLSFHRHTAAGADVLTTCLVEVLDLPGAGVGHPGVGDIWSTGIIRYPVRLRRLFPFLWDSTEDSDDTTEVGAAPGTATVAVSTASIGRCGAKFIFDVTGAVNKVKVANATTSTEFTVSTATGFADNDWIDMYHVDKLGATDPLAGVAAGDAVFMENAGGEAKASLWLAPGNNAITITRITGAGTAIVTIKNQPVYASI